MEKSVRIEQEDFIFIKMIVSDRYFQLKEKMNTGKENEVNIKAFLKIEELYVKYCK